MANRNVVRVKNNTIAPGRTVCDRENLATRYPLSKDIINLISTRFITQSVISLSTSLVCQTTGYLESKSKNKIKTKNKIRNDVSEKYTFRISEIFIYVRVNASSTTVRQRGFSLTPPSTNISFYLKFSSRSCCKQTSSFLTKRIFLRLVNLFNRP